MSNAEDEVDDDDDDVLAFRFAYEMGHSFDKSLVFVEKQPSNLMASVRLSNWTSEAKYLAFAGSYRMATVSVLKIVLRRDRTSLRSTLSHGGLEDGSGH